jgi:hypothetical protein
MYETPRPEYPPNPTPPAYYQPQPVQPRQRADGFAIASLVLGILWLFWVGSALALIFGNISAKQARRAGYKPSGLAVAGMVLGWIGTGTAAFVILVTILGSIGSGS